MHKGRGAAPGRAVRPRPDATPRRRRRFLRLPSGRVWLGLAAVLVVIGVVAPLRRGASNALSRVIFLAATPLAPSVAGFSDLPQPTKLLAADGSELARIDGTQGSRAVTLKSLPGYVPQPVLPAEAPAFYHPSGL